MEAREARSLAFAAEWQRVFGRQSGVEWASHEGSEIDAWIATRDARVRCHIDKAVSVLSGRATREGDCNEGARRLLRLLRQAGAILEIGGRR